MAGDELAVAPTLSPTLIAARLSERRFSAMPDGCQSSGERWRLGSL